jgi:hypothetical protein
MTCNAIRSGDQMQCGRCGLSWDVNDPDRPACNPINMAKRAQRERSLWKLNNVRKTHGLNRR